MTDDSRERREGQQEILAMVRNTELDVAAIKTEVDRLRGAVEDNRSRLDAVEQKQRDIKDGQNEIISRVDRIGEDTGALRELAKAWTDSQAVIRVTKASGKALLSFSAVAAAAVAAWHFMTDFLDR